MEEKKCLKCGRSCREDQAFCDECLAEMEKHPVKPGVVVLLPQREQTNPRPTRRRAAPTPEEQVTKLKRKLIALRLALLLALAAIGGLAWLTMSDYLAGQEEAKPLPGQNYSSEEAVSPSDAE